MIALEVGYPLRLASKRFAERFGRMRQMPRNRRLYEPMSYREMVFFPAPLEDC